MSDIFRRWKFPISYLTDTTDRNSSEDYIYIGKNRVSMTCVRSCQTNKSIKGEKVKSNQKNQPVENSIVMRTNDDSEVTRYPAKYCGCCGRVLEETHALTVKELNNSIDNTLQKLREEIERDIMRLEGSICKLQIKEERQRR